MHGVSDRLEKRGEGTYIIDENRSAIFLERTKNFPKNSEFDIMLTFSGIPTGKLLQTVTPSPKSVTVHQHHSFVELPDKNYIPREFDPRSGANGLHFFDYSTPVNESTKIPNNIAPIEDLKGEFLSENGNKKTTGQQGDIPFIFKKSKEDIMKAGKQIIVKIINNNTHILLIN